jgi:O-antigen/teichoic acid export membrane protein
MVAGGDRKIVTGAGGVIARTFVSRLVALALTALVYILAARSLGTKEFGKASALVGVVAVASVLIDAGTSAHVLRNLAQDRGFASAGAALRWRMATGAGMVGTSLLVAGVLAWRQATVITVAIPVVMAVWISTLSIESLATAMRVGLGHAVQSSSIAIVDRFSALAVLTALTKMGHDSGVSMCVALIAGSAAGCLLGHRQLGLAAVAARTQQMRDALVLVKQSAGFLWSSLGAQLQNIDVTIVGLLAGSAAAGVLAAPSRLTTPIGVAAASAASIVLAQARYLRNDEDRSTQAIAKVTAGVLAVTMLGTLPLWGFPTVTARALLGPQYVAGATVLRLVAVGACIAAVNQPLAAHLQARLRQRHVGLCVFVGGVTGVATVAALAHPLGAIGGGIGVLVAQCVVLAGLVIDLRKSAFRRGDTHGTGMPSRDRTQRSADPRATIDPLELP